MRNVSRLHCSIDARQWNEGWMWRRDTSDSQFKPAARELFDAWLLGSILPPLLLWNVIRNLVGCSKPEVGLKGRKRMDLTCFLSWLLAAVPHWSNEWIAKYSFYFHLSGWVLPMIQTALVYVFGAIDGDPVTGVCYVGNTNSNNLLFFVIGECSSSERPSKEDCFSADHLVLLRWPSVPVYRTKKSLGNSI